MYRSILVYIEEDPEKIRKSLDNVLQGNEFKDLWLPPAKNIWLMLIEYLKKNQITKIILDWLVQLLSGFFYGVFEFLSPYNPFLYIIMGLLLAGILIFVVFLIKKKINLTILRETDSRKEESSLDPFVYEKMAEKSFSVQNYPDAIRFLYRAFLLYINTKGILEYDRSRTNRETERILIKTGTENFNLAIQRVHSLFEDKIYARRNCSLREFEEFREYLGVCRREIG